MNEEVKKTLQKQLQLLSEHSEKEATAAELPALTHAMCEIADRILNDEKPKTERRPYQRRRHLVES